MSALTRIAIIGDGKMGQAIQALAAQYGCEIVTVIGEKDNVGGAGITASSLGKAQVAVEFTQPDSAVANIRACIRAGLPVVVGTTGWYDKLGALSDEVASAKGAMLWSANFSLGVNLMIHLVRRAGEMLADSDAFDVHLIETHHAAKKDAPSGTAKVLAEALNGSSGREIPITSIRTGAVPGTHELVFDGAFEQITLTHTARDRRVFAEGALRAARWIVGKKGVFTMADIL